MNPLSRKYLIDAAIYYSKAVSFALVSYLLLFAVYGGARISLLAWSAVVVFAFTVAYIPSLARSVRAAKAAKGKPGSENR